MEAGHVVKYEKVLREVGIEPVVRDREIPKEGVAASPCREGSRKGRDLWVL